MKKQKMDKYIIPTVVIACFCACIMFPSTAQSQILDPTKLNFNLAQNLISCVRSLKVLKEDKSSVLLDNPLNCQYSSVGNELGLPNAVQHLSFFVFGNLSTVGYKQKDGNLVALQFDKIVFYEEGVTNASAILSSNQTTGEGIVKVVDLLSSSATVNYGIKVIGGNSSVSNNNTESTSGTGFHFAYVTSSFSTDIGQVTITALMSEVPLSANANITAQNVTVVPFSMNVFISIDNIKLDSVSSDNKTVHILLSHKLFVLPESQIGPETNSSIRISSTSTNAIGVLQAATQGFYGSGDQATPSNLMLDISNATSQGNQTDSDAQQLLEALDMGNQQAITLNLALHTPLSSLTQASNTTQSSGSNFLLVGPYSLGVQEQLSDCKCAVAK
ncbi:hypothetical protein ABK040_014676 [Willaertia magna]